MELVTALGPPDRRIRCLQIGLGVPGGTHLLLEALFVEVVTIECDRSVSDQFAARCPLRNIVVGDSHSLGTRDTALARGPYDLLLIDGDHSRAGALVDFRDFAPMVRPGGLVALHDAACLSEVAAAVREIRDSGRDVRMIGDEVGLATVRITT
jgi:predicted O-methyltransferase YrrM